jgi:hypothetical protein
MESGGDECAFTGQMVGLADRVDSDVIPDVARMSATIAERPYHTRFFLPKRMVDQHKTGMRFRGNQEHVRSRLCSAGIS